MALNIGSEAIRSQLDIKGSLAHPLAHGVCNDASFFNLIDFIEQQALADNSHAHAQSDNNNDAQRPAKRARTDAHADYVPVARRTLSVCQRWPDSPNTKPAGRPLPFKSVSHLQINKLYAIHYRKQDGITLTARGRSAPQSVRKVRLEDLTGITDAHETILELAEKLGSSQPRHGRFHTAAFASINHADGSNNGTPAVLTTLTIELELRWMKVVYVGSELHTESERSLRNNILSTFFPDVVRKSHSQRDGQDGGSDKWSPQVFYEAAHVTSKADGEQDDLYVPGLTADLFPFQRRAVKWLLKREGVRWAPDEATRNADDKEPSVVVPYEAPNDPGTTSHFIATKDADGETCYVSDFFGVVTRDPGYFEAYEKSIRGGILAEEMGLGKTVEMISLILLHPRPPELAGLLDDDEKPSSSPSLRNTGATLIVAPPALKSQWVDEFSKHAPHLRVMVYDGMMRSCSSEDDEAAMVEQFIAHDVVVTTYNELKSELHFAIAPPERNMRSSVGSNGENRKRYRPRSPLVQCSWWRVCLDEAQEIESGVSNAATVVRVIPRVNAWGVTGTPVKDGVQDLWGLLLFLLYEPYASVPKVWQQLTRQHKVLFQNLFGRIALRHSKRTVGNELVIPPQKRYVITMPFTAVEEQHYQTMMKRLISACDLDTTGAPTRPDWRPDDPAVLEAMRTALSRLRMTVLHPEFGGNNRQAQGHRVGPMRTVAEVLDAMIEQSESALIVDRRALLAHKLKRGQLLENSPRAKEALAIWQEVLEESKVLVQEARDKLKIETEKAKDAGDDTSGSGGHGGNESEDGDSDGDEDEDQEDKAAGGRLGEAQRELRYALEILHKAEFFCANGHFQVKSNEDWTKSDSDEFRQLEKLEVEGYERAKRVRQEILHENRAKAMRFMADLAGKADSQGFVEIPECDFARPEGIEGRRISDNLDRLAEVLSNQAAQIDEWREAVIQLLLKDLVDDDDEADKSGAAVEITGDEYEDSTKVQDEIQAYITILKTSISDRNKLLTGIAPSGLALYEERLALRMAKDNEGPAPELMLKLFNEREASLLPADGGIVRPLREAIVDLREIASRLRGQQASGGNSLNSITSQRATMELSCVSRQLKRAQEEQTRQLKVTAALEKETNKVRNALNTRIAYYRQLQVVSDMVALYEGPKDDQAIAAQINEEDELVRALSTAESKHRYLLHLKEVDTKEESRQCVICQSAFSIGVLTICGHQFCKECITLWFKAHRNCPMCKRKLNETNLHDITLKPRELKVVDERSTHGQAHQWQDKHQQNDGQPSARDKKTPGIYAAFSAEKVAEIKNIDLPGPSFTTKVDTLVRHLLWLRASDPGAKSIVFSQYPAFLSILSEALQQYRIGFTRYADRDGIERFKADPSVECFLLHARAHSSGLNLVNASHVLLCEPLLNTALELQAIARVHRIGQTHETTVWLYVVEDTVEESIYELSVQRRMAHIGQQQQQQQQIQHVAPGAGKGKGREAAESATDLLNDNLELANSLEMQQAQLSKLMGKGKMAGEEVDKGDLWTCLFGSGLRTAADAESKLWADRRFRTYMTASAAEARQGQSSA